MHFSKLFVNFPKERITKAVFKLNSTTDSIIDHYSKLSDNFLCTPADYLL